MLSCSSSIFRRALPNHIRTCTTTPSQVQPKFCLTKQYQLTSIQLPYTTKKAAGILDAACNRIEELIQYQPPGKDKLFSLDYLFGAHPITPNYVFGTTRELKWVSLVPCAALGLRAPYPQKGGPLTFRCLFLTIFSLSKMAAIGFDYDFTLANYTPEIQILIYNLARDYLVKHMR